MTETKELTGIVVAAQGGDPNAFNELYETTAPDLKIVGYGILHNKEDVEDALQDTYMTIYRSFSAQGISPLQHPERFLPWAKQIMKNTCLNLIANRKRKAGKDELRPMNSEDDQLGMDRIDNPDDDLDFSPEDVAETKYVRKLLDDALSGIPAIRQTCLALNQQGLTYREIGEKLIIPEGTAKSHVRYAKAQLRKRIKEIEKKEDVELHGIVFIQGPFGLKLMGQVRPKKSWITAEVKKDVIKKSSHTKHVVFANVGRRVTAAFMSVVLMAVVGIGPVKSPENVNEVLPLPVVAEAGVDANVESEKSSKETKVDLKDLKYKQNSKFSNKNFNGFENEYFEPTVWADFDRVEITPFHIWYQNGKLHVNCYVINTTTEIANKICLEELEIKNGKGTIAKSAFGELNGISLEPGEYTTYLFVFPKENTGNKDLKHEVDYIRKISWENTTGREECTFKTFTSNNNEAIPDSAKVNSTRSTGNAYENTDFDFMETGPNFTPYKAWYEGDKLYVDCHIKNETRNSIRDLNISKLMISNEDGIIGENDFGLLQEIVLGPNEQMDYEFVFPIGTFKQADLTKELYCSGNMTWQS